MLHHPSVNFSIVMRFKYIIYPNIKELKIIGAPGRKCDYRYSSLPARSVTSIDRSKLKRRINFSVALK
jgi:hypothetical protein